MTPIDPLFLVIPLVASLLTRSKSDDSPQTGFRKTLALESCAGSGPSKRDDRFLPLDDLIIEASRTGSYRLVEPFAESGKGVGEVKDEGDEAEWMGSADVVALCALDCVRTRLKDACETQSESLFHPFFFPTRTRDA